MTMCVIITRCAKTQIKRNRKMRQCVISRIGKFICHSGINTVAWRKAGTITVVSLIEDLPTNIYIWIDILRRALPMCKIHQMMESPIVNACRFTRRFRRKTLLFWLPDALLVWRSYNHFHTVRNQGHVHISSCLL